MSDNCVRPGLSTDDGRETSNSRTSIPTGGARRDRTDDLLLAKQALSQLSYGPACRQRACTEARAGNLLFEGVPAEAYDAVKVGGPGSTRTIDLTLIRGAL